VSALHDPVLLLIDLQKAVDDASWGERNNPQAEQNVARLLAAWRGRRLRVIHVRHDSLEPGSTYRPGGPGHAFKPEAMPAPEEPVVVKQTNSAFIGTQLEAMLRAEGRQTFVVAGVSTSNSVEATVRMGGNLGFDVYLVADGTFTFAKQDWGGRQRSAQEVHDMSLANMSGEYCKVVDTAWVLHAIGA